jgi:hypothetical protein
VPSPRLTAASLLALALVFAPACSSGEGQRAEAARVLHAVDRLVAADRGAKAPPLRELEAQPCADPTVCRAKAACVGAFQPLEESARLQREVRAAMAANASAPSPEAGAGGAKLPPDRALELFEKTDRAERAKQASEQHMDACLQEAARLRTTLRL